MKISDPNSPFFAQELTKMKNSKSSKDSDPGANTYFQDPEDFEQKEREKREKQEREDREFSMPIAELQNMLDELNLKEHYKAKGLKFVVCEHEECLLVDVIDLKNKRVQRLTAAKVKQLHQSLNLLPKKGGLLDIVC